MEEGENVVGTTSTSGSGSASLGEDTRSATSRVSASRSSVELKLRDMEALEQNWKGVVDVVDSLLERADMRLDEFTGLIKRGAEKEGAAVCLISTLSLAL